jgi:hypothetical protein
MEKNSLAASQEPESFIVQNATLSYHFISDIGLSFSPKEVKDLTWEDPNIIKKSRNLKDALRTGYLKRLSPEQYEKTLDLQYRKEQKQLEKDQQRKATYSKQKNKNGNDMIAERVDLERASRKNANELDIAGTANHPMSVVQAYAIAESRAQERGDELSVEEFLQFVEHHPNTVAKLLSETRVSTASASVANAYYAQPRGDVNSETGVVKASMKNINRALMGEDRDQDYEQVEQKMSDILDVDDFEEIDNMYVEDNFLDSEDEDDGDDFAEEIIIEEEEN